jgi:hypothetical protein
VNGHIPVGRRLLTSDSGPNASPEDPRQQERHRTILQDSIDLSHRLPNALLRLDPQNSLELALLQLHARDLCLDHCLYDLRHAV